MYVFQQIAITYELLILAFKEIPFTYGLSLPATVMDPVGTFDALPGGPGFGPRDTKTPQRAGAPQVRAVV